MTSASELVSDLVAQLQADRSVMQQLRRTAAARAARVVLCEAEDPRVAAAAAVLREFSIAQCVLVGRDAALRESLLAVGVDPGRFDRVDVGDRRLERAAQHLFERRRAKGMTEEEARTRIEDPLFAGAALLGAGMADAMVAGATRPTADVLRAGLWCVGTAPGVECVSASFLMLPPDGAAVDRPLLFADAAVVPEPTEAELVDIAESASRLFEGLFGRRPHIAALSFSTAGSADHPATRKMASVARTLVERGRSAVGEVQADAALDCEIARRKGIVGDGAGFADILLFPDLAAANIGYKLVQRLGGYRAVGPLVQGFARPLFDLSRGCSARDVFDTVVVAIASGRTSDDPDERSR